MVIFMTNMDKLAIFVPSSTMQGFKLAVCVIIVCNQINFALGLNSFTRHPSFIDNVIENLNHINETEWQAVVMFSSFLIGQFALTALAPRVPWSVVTVTIGILFGYLSNIDGMLSYKFRTLDSRYPGLTLSIFSFPDLKPEYFEPATFYALFLNAISFAFVAVLQVVISAK
jgi:MFS superfamily sulfate permease-like transporter